MLNIIENVLLSTNRWIIIVTILLTLGLLIIIEREISAIVHKSKTVKDSFTSKVNITLLILLILGSGYTFMFFKPYHLNLEDIDFVHIHNQSGSFQKLLTHEEREHLKTWIEEIEFKRVYFGTDTYPSDKETYDITLGDTSSMGYGFTVTLIPDEVAVHTRTSKTKSIAVDYEGHYEMLLKLINTSD